MHESKLCPTTHLDQKRHDYQINMHIGTVRYLFKEHFVSSTLIISNVSSSSLDLSMLLVMNRYLAPVSMHTLCESEKMLREIIGSMKANLFGNKTR